MTEQYTREQRLAAIIAHFEKCYDLDVSYSLKDEDADFLLAEIDRLQQENELLQEMLAVRVHRDHLDKAIEGLRWYADQSNYYQPRPFATPFAEVDKGENARRILSELGVSQ